MTTGVHGSTGLPWLIVTQFLVTMGLLSFAAFVVTDVATQSLILGAVITHWLKEGTHLGQQVSESRQSQVANPTTSAGG